MRKYGIYEKNLVGLLIRYDRIESCVARVIAAILIQTYADYEVIAVNKASMDETGSVFFQY